MSRRKIRPRRNVAHKKSNHAVTKSAFVLSQRARTIGASIGAVIGNLFAEDPDGFVKVITDSLDQIKASGIPLTINGVPLGGAPVEAAPTQLWWQRKITADWYVDKDGTQHAFALCSKGPPGQSACGDVWLDLSTLKLAGYTVHKRGNIITGGTGPLDQGPPDPPGPAYAPPATGTTTASARRGKKSRGKRTSK
jgi:hypothetical protein